MTPLLVICSTRIPSSCSDFEGFAQAARCPLKTTGFMVLAHVEQVMELALR